jgi:hypothetical protein
MYHTTDLLVPLVIFVAGIIVSWAGSSFGIQRVVEAQKTAGETMARTATYESPLRSEHDSIHGGA